MFMMATKVQTSQHLSSNEMINVFNIDTKKIVAKYCLKDGFLRYLSSILKDGGGKKLLYWNNILVAVCPEVEKNFYVNRNHSAETRLVLKFFDLSLLWSKGNDDDVLNLEPFGEYVLQNVDLRKPLGYIASDQKGPNIILAFSKKFPECMSQQFVSFSIEDKKTTLSSIKVYDKNSLRYFFYFIIGILKNVLAQANGRNER